MGVKDMGEIVWDEQSISRLWKHYSKGDKRTYFGWHSGYSLIRYLQRKGIIFDNIKILDFGCGNAYLYKWMKSLCKNFSYTGADTSEESVEYLKKRYGGSLNAIHIEDLPIPCKDNSFDMILATEMVEHVDDKMLDQDLKEWARLLREGGKLIITTPNDEDLSASMIYCPNCDCSFHMWQHVRKWTKKTLRSYVEDRGFKVVWCEETMLYSKNMKKRKYLRAVVKCMLRITKWPNLIMVCEKIK